MNKYIMTFGCGQRNAGMCLPIFANSENEARAEMFRLYGKDWCTSYTEEAWEAWKIKARQYGVPIEVEMPPVYCAGGTQ